VKKRFHLLSAENRAFCYIPPEIPAIQGKKVLEKAGPEAPKRISAAGAGAAGERRARSATGEP
jgi:hypothetical protein